MTKRRDQFDFRPTAAEVNRLNAALAGLSVTEFAAREAEQARKSAAIREANRKAAEEYQEVPNLLRALETHFNMPTVDEPVHTTPGALRAAERRAGLLDMLEEAYQKPAIADQDRNPMRPPQFVAVGEVAVHPELDGPWRDDSWYNTLRDIRGLDTVPDSDV